VDEINCLKNILARPEYIEGVGNIYPILIKDYDKFQNCSGILNISKNHFKDIDAPLLDLIFVCANQLGTTERDLIINFNELFSLVLRKEIRFNNSCWIDIENKCKIDSLNYEQIRSVIMKQNLMFEPKVYKTELMNKWAKKAMEAKRKNAPKITLEDMLSTISTQCGKHYWELENYTIYQIYTDFYRSRKRINHDVSVQYKCVDGKFPIEEYAESLDLYHNPYDDLFVSSDKLGGLNKAVKA
jgi:hypothetical protein